MTCTNTRILLAAIAVFGAVMALSFSAPAVAADAGIDPTVTYTPQAGSSLRLPRVFTDHMVIQQEKPLTVWGWTAPGETVSVAFGGQLVSAKADGEGRWSV